VKWCRKTDRTKGDEETGISASERNAYNGQTRFENTASAYGRVAIPAPCL